MASHDSLTFRSARVVTPRAQAARTDLHSLDALPGHTVTVRAGVIAGIWPDADAPPPAPDARVIHAGGRVLLPAFVDCHTHACWSGDRLEEWSMRLRGVPYLDILAQGGGIMSTVRSVRKSSAAMLTGLLLPRIHRFLNGGTTTIEIKSGYGLTTADELKMLAAIHDARTRFPGTIVATALLGHAIDPDQPDFISRTLLETLPEVHRQFPGIAIDAYCERGAWSVDDTTRLLDKARTLGHPVRVHTDQFNSLGMIPQAINLAARSADHLESATDADLRAISHSSVTAVGLPVCGLHMADQRFAPLGKMLSMNADFAIATNCNPGSAPSTSMPLAIAAATRYCGIPPSAAIAAATSRAAHVLRLDDRGTIRAGARADLILLRHTDERMLAFEIGDDPIDMVVCNGSITRG